MSERSEVNLNTAEIVGRGLTSDVYSWGEGRVLKLFYPQFAASKVESEFAMTRAVHAAGIPAPAAHEVVEIEGRLGIVLERVEGRSLIDCVQTRPWTLFAVARQFAQLHAQLHGLLGPTELPQQRQRIANTIEAARDLPEADKEAARRHLADLPDGEALCHGDFHPGNILVSWRGPVIIDWETASRGHPLGDVARTSHLFRHADLPASTPMHIRLLFKTSRGLLHATYLKRYLQLRPGTREQIAAWELPLRAAASAWRAEAGLSQSE